MKSHLLPSVLALLCATSAMAANLRANALRLRRGATLAAAAGFLAAPVWAADYYVVVPVKGRTAAAPAESIAVSLQAATLPAAMVGQAYSYNLSDHLLITGDKTLDLNQATLTTADALPTGLSLAANGVLSGTPTVKNEAGASFQVLASYKGKEGQQAYTIVVNGVPLEVTQVTAGGQFTCALTTSGGVKCWGSNTYGQLGNNTTVNQSTPVDVVGLTSGVVSLSAGGSHTCAVTTTGALRCWGYDAAGQLGNDAALTNQLTPVGVFGLTSGVASVSASGNATCALTTSGGAKCWGENSFKQVGNTSAGVRQPTPIDVSGLTSGVASISQGGYTACAITTSGGLKCWGWDGYGQVGNDAALTSQPTPVDVAGLTSGVASVSAGGNHTCAVTTTGALKCWGYDNDGQLGDDAALINQPTPVTVSGLASGVASVETGGGHTCALTTFGRLKCWGRGTFGQLGYGSEMASQPTPVDVNGMTSGVASVSAGGNHTCALTTFGGLKCWGSDVSGQLGNDTALTDKPTPVDVAP